MEYEESQIENYPHKFSIKMYNLDSQYIPSLIDLSDRIAKYVPINNFKYMHYSTLSTNNNHDGLMQQARRMTIYIKVFFCFKNLDDAFMFKLNFSGDPVFDRYSKRKFQ